MKKRMYPVFFHLRLVPVTFIMYRENETERVVWKKK
jgi:hypothetical protein